MKRILLLVILMSSGSLVLAQSDYYIDYIKKAQSYQWDAEYYQTMADGYRREATYYLKKAEGYQRWISMKHNYAMLPMQMTKLQCIFVELRMH